MGTEESALTLACARTPGLCHIISVSDNHLETEMPCNMFVRASASGARVSLTFPPSATGSDSPPLFAEDWGARCSSPELWAHVGDLVEEPDVTYAGGFPEDYSDVFGAPAAALPAF